MLDIFHTIFKYREKESPDRLGYYPERHAGEALPVDVTRIGYLRLFKHLH